MTASNTNYCCFDGHLIPVDSVKITTANRAFRYGDSVFETIRCFGNRPFALGEHYSRIKRAMQATGMEPDSLPTCDVLEKKIESLINRNRYFISSRVRLMVFRKDGGLYTPATDQSSYMLEATPIDQSTFEMNEKGLVAGIFRDMGKSPDVLSPYKTGSALLYVMAAKYKQRNNLTECFIVNTNGMIIESISSNLFWFKNDKLYTPTIASGCVDGIMRRQVIALARNLNIEVFEVPGVSEENIRKADEIFVTNAIQGIQWVVGIDDLRYFNIKTKQLYREFIKSIN
ncbi:MAG: aminotransferase class IV family protein [Marinilabiliaceae bacterium]|nr:aminotransferase class IV family protein [Marinilabiliaceae bacterium]